MREVAYTMRWSLRGLSSQGLVRTQRARRRDENPLPPLRDSSCGILVTAPKSKFFSQRISRLNLRENIGRTAGLSVSGAVRLPSKSLNLLGPFWRGNGQRLRQFVWSVHQNVGMSALQRLWRESISHADAP